MKKIILVAFLMLLTACAGQSSIRQPVKESVWELGGRYPQVMAWLKGMKSYQDLPAEVQNSYFEHQTYFEIAKLLIRSDKISDEQVMQYLLQRSVPGIKNEIKKDQSLPKGIKESLNYDISRTVVKYSNRFSWRTKWTKSNKYQYNFVPKNNGFDAQVIKSPQLTYWGIQIITDNYIITEDQGYILQFHVYSNKGFQLNTCIHTDTTDTINLYRSCWHTINAGKWQHEKIELHGNSAIKNGLLHFKVGEAPPGTILKVRNISIEPLD